MPAKGGSHPEFSRTANVTLHSGTAADSDPAPGNILKGRGSVPGSFEALASLPGGPDVSGARGWLVDEHCLRRPSSQGLPAPFAITPQRGGCGIRKGSLTRGSVGGSVWEEAVSMQLVHWEGAGQSNAAGLMMQRYLATLRACRPGSGGEESLAEVQMGMGSGGQDGGADRVEDAMADSLRER
eukprot:1515041-Rhodomonas_salina.1